MIAHPKRLLTICALMSSLVWSFLTTVASGASAPVVAPPTVVNEGISSPVKIAADQQGNFYLTDPRGGGILKFDRAGNLLKTISTVKSPQGIAVTSGGDLIVGQGDYVAVLDGNGTEKFRLGQGPGQFKMANGIAVDATGFIYVVDSLDNCVQVFTANGSPATIGVAAPGKPANSFGTFGAADGQFAMPTGITYEKISNQLAIVDTRNGRIQFFSTAGIQKRTVGTFGSGSLKFTAPQAVAFEYTKSGPPTLTRMYVVDSFQSNVQAIDPAGTGTFLKFIGGYGPTTGRLMNPSDGLFDMSDPINSRLVIVNGRGNLTFYGIDKGTVIAGPTLTVNPLPSVTNVQDLNVSGTVSAGASVTVNNKSATVTGASWALPSPLQLVSGTNVISVVATDGGGNISTVTEIVVFDPTSTQLTVNPVTTPTNVSSQTITGTVEAGASVKVNGTAATVTGTTWSYNATLTKGSNSFTITASIAGKKDSTTTVTIALQSINPFITLSMLSDGSTAAGQIQNVTGLVNGPNIASITVNGRPVTVANGSFSTTVNLINGANIITVATTDTSGNTTTETFTFNFDATQPAPAIAVSPPDGTITDTSTITLSGTVVGGAIVTVNGNAAVVDNNGNWTFPANLSSGLNTFQITVKDPSGRSSSVKRSITFDPARPALAMDSPAQDLATSLPNIVITGTAAGNGITLTATVNGNIRPVTFNNGVYTFSADFPAEGAYSITITATDANGHVSTNVRTVIFDVTAPQFSVDPITSPSQTKFSGTIEQGATLAVSDKNGPLVGKVVIGSDGKWSVDLTGVNFDPTTLSFTANDAAGNSSRDGDVDGNGVVDIVDAINALRLAVGLGVSTSADLLHGDVAPLRNHVPAPDGKIDIDDVMVIMRRVVGIPW